MLTEWKARVPIGLEYDQAVTPRPVANMTAKTAQSQSDPRCD